LQPREKFATGIWALLQSGYALLVRGPDAGILSDNPAELPLIESKTVFKQSRPPLLAATTSGDKKICTEFMNSIQDPRNFFESRKGKFIKSLAMTAIGTGAGAVIDQGLAGFAAGALISKIAEPAVDLGLDLLDEYLLNNLTKGWQPRMFFDTLKNLRETTD
jgi:hypothetical protein